MPKIAFFLSLLFAGQIVWGQTKAPQVTENEGYKQMVIGFTLASTVAYALHNYYSYYKSCPATIEELNLSDVSEFADSPLQSVSLDSACQLHINYKEEPYLVTGLRGKTIILEERLDANAEHFIASCRFNGDTKYAPQADCQLTPAQQQALTPAVLERGEWFSKLYNEKGAIPTLTGPMNEAVLLIFEQKKLLTAYYERYGKCPANNEALAIAKPQELSGYFVASITIAGCEIVAQLKEQANLFPELRGKELLLRLVPTQQQGVYQWQCGSNADQQFLPSQCQWK